MKIAIGADHAGYQAKDALRSWLEDAGHEVVNVGTDGPGSVDYPDYAEEVARFVAGGGRDRIGVLVCGTGVGISIAANKIPGVRAATCHDEFTARMCRAHNDANVVCMGARILAVDRMKLIIETFMGTEFEGGRHVKRLEKIARLEGELPREPEE